MKKRNLIYSIFLIFILLSFLLIFILFGYNSKKENSESKAEQEIEYLENKIIAMMNSLNNINFSNSVLTEKKTKSSSESSQAENNESGSGSQGTSKQQGGEQGNNTGGGSSTTTQGSNTSENETKFTSQETTTFEVKNSSILLNDNITVDWENIKSNTETIYSTWATTTIDLHALNVNNNDILNFSNVLDEVTLSVKKEDKIATLNNLASLYAFLPKYREQISEDNQKINLDYTKTCVLNTYALVEQDEWDEMKTQATNAINYFSNIMNSIEETNKNQNQISKIYVLLNELNNSISIKDKELYLIKYRNVMEELMNF